MSHQHAFEPPHDLSAMYTQEFWDARYRSADALWSGKPNAQLMEQVADLTPGTALDVGSGEGADAIWLASRGWRVTATDISTVALQRAAARAATVGSEVQERITWQQEDVLSWTPPSAQFDLVSAQFLHPPEAVRGTVFARLAAAVRPGGTLLIVGHHPSDLDTRIGRPNIPGLLFTAESVATGLDPEQWQVVVAAATERQTLEPEGQSVIIRDAVLRARRRTA